MNTLLKNETIVALSTPVGVGAISIVRLSGPNVRQILSKIFISKTSAKELPKRTPVLGNFIDIDGEIFDEGQVVLYEKPNSYTGEDLAELFCHGSIAIYQFLIESACSAGARVAGPGEFTRRAFIEGKIDLVQSESVADLISSETRTSAKIALSQLQGTLSACLEEIWQQIVEIGAHLEASIDFPDEFEPGAGPMVQGRPLFGEELAPLFANTEKSLKDLEDSFRSGKILREGARIAIIGRPNVGKSTLVNSLVGEKVSIVTSKPQTTQINILGIVHLPDAQIMLVDTPGLLSDKGKRLNSKQTSKETRNALAMADFAVIVVEANRWKKEDDYLMERLKEFNFEKLLAVNKIDLFKDLKKRILKNSLLDLNILKVYDDREELIQMWREAGLECVDCSSQEV